MEWWNFIWSPQRKTSNNSEFTNCGRGREFSSKIVILIAFIVES